MTYIPFSDEIRDFLFEEVALNSVIPRWVERIGGADTEAVQIFNRTMGTSLGIRINRDGTAVRTR